MDHRTWSTDIVSPPSITMLFIRTLSEEPVGNP